MLKKKYSIHLRFAKNFTWLFLFNGLGYIFSFLALPILINKYSLAQVGFIYTTQAIVLGLASFANFSFVYYIPTVSKEICDDAEKRFQLWNLTVQIRLLLSIILLIISVIIVLLFFEEFFLLYMVSLSLLITKIINPNLFFNALEKNKYIFSIGFFSKLIFLLLIYISNDFIKVNFFLAISEFIVIVFYLKKVHQNVFKLKGISLKELLNYMKQTTNLFFVNIFSMLKPHSILPIISGVFGAEFAALFTLADKVINVIKGVSGIIFVSIFPIYNKDKLKAIVLGQYQKFLLVLTPILITIIIWQTSDYLIYFLNDFNENILASKTLKILSLSTPVFFLIIPLFSYFLQNKKWNVILLISIFQLLALAISLSLLISQNIIGIAKSIVISEYVLLGCYLYYFYNQKLNLFSFRG